MADGDRSCRARSALGRAFYRTRRLDRTGSVQAELARLLGGKPAAFTATGHGHGAADFVAPNTKPDGSESRSPNRRVTIIYEN